MHILFLSHYFPPEVNAPASRTYDHARRWVKAPGVRVTVITNHPNHPYGILYDGYKNQWLTREKTDNIDICRVKTYLAPNAGFLRRILNYLFFMFSASIASFTVKNPDLVIATSPQFFCAGAGFLVSRLKNRPFIFELRDLWPDSIVSVGAMKPSPVIRLLEKLELFLYRRSKHVVALTDAFRRNLLHRGIPDHKISVIKNSADLSFFSPRPVPASLARELGVEGKFVVSYIGTVGMAHAVDKILETAEMLREFSDIVFLIIGEGAYKRKIRDMSAQKNLPNVKVLPGVPKEKIPDYYALTDLNLVTLRNLPLFRTVIPSKIFEIMAMARPILCAVDGECRELVEQSGCGIFTPPENAEQMAEGIKNLRQDPKTLILMGEKGRKFAERYFNRDELAHRYLDLLKSLTQ